MGSITILRSEQIKITFPLLVRPAYDESLENFKLKWKPKSALTITLYIPRGDPASDFFGRRRSIKIVRSGPFGMPNFTGKCDL